MAELEKAKNDMDLRLAQVRNLKDMAFVRQIKTSLMEAEPDAPLPDRHEVATLCEIVERMVREADLAAAAKNNPSPMPQQP